MSDFPHPVAVAAPAGPPPTTVNLGFLTVVQEPSGWVGGYLVTNGWGRPVEFRLSTAVQPNRVQAVLYGPTLAEYLHADLIGKTLWDKTAAPADVMFTDAVAALPLRSRVGVPVACLAAPGDPVPADALVVRHPRCGVPLLVWSKYPADEAAVVRLLDAADSALDVAEPFARIREAVAEARKTGVTARVA